MTEKRRPQVTATLSGETVSDPRLTERDEWARRDEQYVSRLRARRHPIERLSPFRQTLLLAVLLACGLVGSAIAATKTDGFTTWLAVTVLGLSVGLLQTACVWRRWSRWLSSPDGNAPNPTRQRIQGRVALGFLCVFLTGPSS
jgi:hypothetical protein